MTDDDRQQREEQAARQFLDGYCQLLAVMAKHAAEGTKAEDVRDTVDAMKESMAKGMLLARLAADAVQAQEVLDRLRFEGLGGDPTMN